MKLSNGSVSTTTKVWETLVASKNGDLERIKSMVDETPDLIYAQYNYTPPIHFAVREGHIELVKFILREGAHDPGYRIYPFQESLEIIAEDRGYDEIVELLKDYAANPSAYKYKGENGEIIYERTEFQQEFEKAVYKSKFNRVNEILQQHPEFAKDETYFWGEGILAFAAKVNNRKMIDLLMSYGARVPSLLKWAQFYYFEHEDGAVYMMEKGMDPNTMSWHHVTLLHDMAQKGKIKKAELLIKYGASLDPVDEEYQSTPLGMAARWGHPEMVEYLLNKGADPNKAGKAWSAPLAWAKKKKHTAVEKILMKHGAKQIED